MSTLAGSTQGYLDGSSKTAKFNSPNGIAIYGDYVIVSDAKNSVIRMITPCNQVVTIAGDINNNSSYPLNGTSASIGSPGKIKPMKVPGKFLISDKTGFAIRTLDVKEISMFLL